jgi:hypothetical protein
MTLQKNRNHGEHIKKREQQNKQHLFEEEPNERAQMETE